MKKIFVDTNVIIDFLSDRKPFSDAATILFSWAAQRKITIYISAISFNNIYYILKQQLSHSKTINTLIGIQEITRTIEVSELIIKKSLQSDFRDFEDAIQHFCAVSVANMGCIVTRNSKDYKPSKIAVMTPTEAIALLNLRN
jgi:predicted nucleic acid-binding protein